MIKYTTPLILIGIIVLGFLGYFEPLQTLLDTETLTFKIGKYSLSAYKLLKGLVALLFLLWIAGFFNNMAEKYFRHLKTSRFYNSEFFIKCFKFIIYSITILISLDVLGIDLSSLVVLGGAVGIGIGFGLQKITSNFISGIILLAEKTIKSNDLVELENGTYGYVRYISARYTLIESFDSKEILVPNEDFVSNRVINCTYSNTEGRGEIKMGVAYGSDLELVKNLLLEAATENPRCSQYKKPTCYLQEFADSSINFILYFWVDNVRDGRLGLKSEILFSIWNKFNKNNISIPFPQHDVYIKNLELNK